ncbi:hypothetical protein BDB13_5923 [Rhodococcus sp. OK302]|nr:hypothetical protein BDB13_5923 [Rhodococcus sp. OK302]
MLSYDVQSGFGGGQSLVRPGKFAGQSRDLGLFGGQFADLLARFLTLEYSGIALLAPFADQRRVQPLPSQVRAAAVFAGVFVRREVRDLVRGGEGAAPAHSHVQRSR